MALLLASRTAIAEVSSPTVHVHYSGGSTKFWTLRNGAHLFQSRSYPVENLPAEMVDLLFTARRGGNNDEVTIDAPAGSTVYLIIGGQKDMLPRTAALHQLLASDGWVRVGDFIYADKNKTTVSAYRHSYSSAKQMTYPSSAWCGTVVAASKLELDDAKPSEGKPDNPRTVKSKDDKSTIHTDIAVNDTPIPGPATRPIKMQSTVNALEVLELSHGLMLGQTSEATLTLTTSPTSKLTAVRFITPVGNEMCLARDEALRFIRLTYPNWYASDASITFQDKYVAHDGGSIGTAIGTIVLSCIEGFEIDPKAAITGDISANGKVRAIGGVSAKIKGATAGKFLLVAIPLDNADQLTDAVIYAGPGVVTDIQVMGIGTLADAVATVRADRTPQLNQAISLFTAVQTHLKAHPAVVKNKDVQLELQKVLELAPHHLSAQVLLAISQGTQPKTLSATASRYYAFLSAGSMMDVLSERAESAGAHSVPSSVVRTGLINLHKLRPLADVNVRPLIDAWCNFISSWNELQENITSAQAVQDRRQALLDEMQKEDTDADMMQKMLKEGM